MEEDIKNLEKMIKEYKQYGDLDNPDYEDTGKICETIENLINRNKELEQEDIRKDKIIDLMAYQISDCNNLEICENCEKICEDDYDYSKCKSCIKEYFEKKAED